MLVSHSKLLNISLAESQCPSCSILARNSEKVQKTIKFRDQTKTRNRAARNFGAGKGWSLGKDGNGRERRIENPPPGVIDTTTCRN